MLVEFVGTDRASSATDMSAGRAYPPADGPLSANMGRAEDICVCFGSFFGGGVCNGLKYIYFIVQHKQQNNPKKMSGSRTSSRVKKESGEFPYDFLHGPERLSETGKALLRINNHRTQITAPIGPECELKTKRGDRNRYRRISTTGAISKKCMTKVAIKGQEYEPMPPGFVGKQCYLEKPGTHEPAGPIYLADGKTPVLSYKNAKGVVKCLSARQIATITQKARRSRDLWAERMGLLRMQPPEEIGPFKPEKYVDHGYQPFNYS